jgi:aminoglycoside phosphotransferase family enzyme
MKTTTSATQSKVCKSLLSKLAYPHRVSTIQTEDTHISWIFLTGPYAYKIKKQVKFGRVLDFSTLSLRRQYYYKEVDLNRKLCKDMYHGVVRIITAPDKNDNRVVIADSFTRTGQVIEYAVKMKHIASEYRMDKLLTAHRIKLENIASILNNFHSRTSTNKEIQKYGQPKYLKYKIKENFQTLAKLKHPRPRAEDKLIKFINNNENLFLTRIRDKKIRDIHGDLYLKNIFIVKRLEDINNQPRIETIQFLEKLTCLDILLLRVEYIVAYTEAIFFFAYITLLDKRYSRSSPTNMIAILTILDKWLISMCL